MAGCVLVSVRSALAMVVLANALLLISMTAEAGGVNFRRKSCDEDYLFAPSEDQNFVEMLDKLLDGTKTTSLKVDVVAKDREGLFEGRAGCLWQNCQIYNSECYDCRSARDATVCIENLINEVKQGLRDSHAECARTREFKSGERSVALDDNSSSFQVCGLQYTYLGNDYLSITNKASY